jgi:uncharacterized membrane protein YeaQ/YmgE (transglycosylase-associated protein family)
MSLIVYLLLLPVIGLIVGAFGRLAIPGPDPMTVGETIFVGIAGSFLAGLVGWLLFGHDGGGLLLSVAFTAGIVYLIRRSRGGSLTRPATRP